LISTARVGFPAAFRLRVIVSALRVCFSVAWQSRQKRWIGDVRSTIW
jgi:hypothetical protein